MEPMEGNKKILAAVVGLGACARLLPHPWNFTPMVAIGVYSGAKSAKLRTGVLVTLLALLLSDAVLGFYRGMWYVYLTTLIPVLIGRLIRRKDGVAPIAAAGLISSLSFFVTINFMVWAFDHTYPLTAAGLAASYAAGIPFYQNQLLGDAFYMVTLFGGDALIRRLMHPAPRTA